MEKLPESHQKFIQKEIAANPDVDTLKQVTTEARQLAKYLKSAAQVQALAQEDVDIETALEEAQRVGCLSVAADLVNQASQIEQTIAKLYMTWKRIGNLADRLYVDTGASTPNLRSLLTCIEPLGGEVMELQLSGTTEHTVRLQIQETN
jgi:HPt (histidine-containing phosphotransfer) domain-containing protein